MGKDVVTFSVEITEQHRGKPDVQKWLTATRVWSSDKGEAVEFTRQRVATNRKQILINEACNELAGGFKKWLDLTTSETDLWEMVAATYQRDLWPPGPSAPGVPKAEHSRPEPKTDEEAAEQWKLMEARFVEDSSPLANGLRVMRRQASEIRFMAQWSVLMVSPPKGWESVADLPDDPPGLLQLLMASYDREASKDLGK